jgi:DNA-directed RNA polymerase subunit RPC12/RpoP
MRIRTRHKLFKLLILLAVVNYLVFLYDVLLNESEFFVYVMIGFLAILFFVLLLYIGVKPDLDDEPELLETVTAEPEADEMEDSLFAAPAEEEPPMAEPTPEPILEEAPEVVEIPKPHANVDAANMRGPHHYRCPFCSHVFGVEATHLRNRRELRVSCPYCANHIRIPAKPKVVVGEVPRGRVEDKDRVAYSCSNCGEVLRITAPQSSIRRRLIVQACSHCGSTRLTRAEVTA